MCLQLIFLMSAFSVVTGTRNTTLTCTSDELQCADGLKCYVAKFQCDGFHDCEDYSDEADCADRQVECDSDELYCEVDNDCLPDLYRCDGFSDCPDGTDELDCGHESSCSPDHEFMCVSDHKCIHTLLRCDGIEHCHDGSDELNCVGPECDLEHEIDCYGNGSKCIAIESQCDGVADCPNGKDESVDLCGKPDEVVDACAVSNGGCEHICVSDPVGHHCKCSHGYALGFDHKSCDDVDECFNSPCSHICDNSIGSFNCRCVSGYQLSDDGQSCVAADGVSPKLLVTNETTLITFDTYLGNMQAVSLGGSIRAIDFDYLSDTVFWVDSTSRNINLMHLNGSLSESLVTTRIDNPVALAFDWIHQNLYWADVGLHPSRAKIEVLTLYNRWRHTLLDESVVRSPEVMVVDPRADQGYLYWGQGASKAGIFRADLDGRNTITVATINVEQPTGMTLDFVSSRLLWIDSRLATLNAYMLTSSRREILHTFLEYPRHPAGLAVFEEWLYWTDEITKAVYKIKCAVHADGNNIVYEVISNLSSPHEVDVYHSLKQPQGDSYCGSNNGGCSHICLPSPTFARRSCSCPDNNRVNAYRLNPDGRTCLTTPFEMSSRSTSTVVAKTTRQLPTSQETRLLSTMLHNGVYKPTVMTSTSSQSSLSVSLMSTEASNEGDAAEFHTIWIHVGVGIVALVLLVVIAVLIIYKIYRLHVKRMMDFNNPTFSTDKDDKTGAQRIPLAHTDDTEQGNMYESVA